MINLFDSSNLKIRFLLASIATAVGACSDDPAEAPRSPAPDALRDTAEMAPEPTPAFGSATWVGGDECAGCHEEAAARWRGSHHDLAMQEPSAEAMLGDFDDARFVDGPTTWTFSRSDGRYVARAEGAERGEHAIAFTFGADPLQQYLIERPGGRLQALHIAWDSRPAAAGGQRWFSLYGDEHVPVGDPIHWLGPALSWNAMCGECHSTRFQKGFELASNSYASSWAEIDVGCEACHGPGSNHVTWARAGGKGGSDHGLSVALSAPTQWAFEGGHPIARPVGGSASPSQELDTCASCHSRRSRIVEDPLPGTPFLEAYQPALLERGLYHDDGQVRDEVYVYGSFLQSRMHEAGVRCSDCHDPHSAGLRAEGNALCGGCHEPAHFDTPEHHHHSEGSSGADCVACHMPAQNFMTVDARHDHSLRIPRPELSAELGSPNPCLGCHAEQNDAWVSAAITRWRGDTPPPPPHFGVRLRARNTGGSLAGRTLIELFDDPTEPSIARATALAELTGDPLALERLAEAAASDDPLLRLAAARAAAGTAALAHAPRIADLLEDPIRAVRIEAAVALADAGPSLSASQRQALARALDEYRAAQEVADDQPSAYANLAMLLEREGDLQGAEQTYQTALRLGDYFVPAYTNLANLLGQQGRDVEGASLLHQGIARAPDSGDLHFALGLALVRLQQNEPALEELAMATSMAPDVAYYAFVYGAGLNSAGRVDEALAVLQAAAERHPNDQNLLGSIATIARDAGRFDEAIAAAERLMALFPDQPEARMLLEDIEARRDGGVSPLSADPSLAAPLP
jgi:predicted CXXCH cytochrome family protein